MQLIHYLNRPEYLFQPHQIYRRIWFRSPANSLPSSISLPWGVNLKIPDRSNDVVIQSIQAYGLYDLSLTELLWRLAEPSAITVDIGAHIGYTTSLLASRVGATGQVWCFEPNPTVYSELSENIELWKITEGWQHIYPHQNALSKQSGTGVLQLTPHNRGEAYLTSILPEVCSSNLPCYEDVSQTIVTILRLDEVLAHLSHIDVLKIDIEGHELDALQGADRFLSQQKIRNIIFEDHLTYPSPVSQFLEAFGYKIFLIWKGLINPQLHHPGSNKKHPWEPPNYLATLDPKRAISCLKKPGWFCLN